MGINELVSKFSSKNKQNGFSEALVNSVVGGEYGACDDSQLLANIRITLMNLFENALTPYNIKNTFFANSVVKDGKNTSLNEVSKNIADIYFAYFSNKNSNFYSIKYSNLSTEKVIVDQNPDKNGQIRIGDSVYDVIDHLSLSSNLDKDSLEQLRVLFFFLNNIYIALGKVAKYSNKPVIGINGLNDLILSAINSDDPAVSKENIIDAIKAQASSVIKSDVAIIDSKTTLNLFSMDVAQIKAMKEFIDSEIARILMIPLTKLTGRPQSGLNTTGGSLYDDKNYEDTLDLIRSKFIEPTLYFFKIPFESTFVIDSNAFSTAMAGLNQMDANIGISIDDKNRLRANLLRPFLRGVDYDGR